MSSNKVLLKSLSGIIMMVVATTGCHSQPKVPNGVYTSSEGSDGTYLYDFQTGGTGRKEWHAPPDVTLLDESTPFTWRIEDKVIFVFANLDSGKELDCAIKWDGDDLIVGGSNMRLVKK